MTQKTTQNPGWRRTRPFPFHPLGYRQNPFGALTEAEWAAIGVLPPPVAAALAKERHLQLLGPKGSGKTSALLTAAARLRRAGNSVVFAHLAEGERRYQVDLEDADVFCLDEAQRLAWWARLRLLAGVRWGKRPLRLIISSHRDLSPAFRRWGLPLSSFSLPALVDVAHWQAVLARRLDYFARPEATPVRLTPEATNWLHEQFGADLRGGEWFLYEVWQQLVGMDGAPRRLTAVKLAEFHAALPYPPD
jgi:hypothetical protein